MMKETIPFVMKLLKSVPGIKLNRPSHNFNEQKLEQDFL